MLRHCSSTMTKDHFLLISYGNKWPLSIDVPLTLLPPALCFVILPSGVLGVPPCNIVMHCSILHCITMLRKPLNTPPKGFSRDEGVFQWRR